MLVALLLYGAHYICTDIRLPHGSPIGCMPYSVGGFLEINVLLMLDVYSHRILRLKICSVVLLPALSPACSSAIISSAWGFSLIIELSTLFSEDKLIWL